jgi:hypothetical protein
MTSFTKPEGVQWKIHTHASKPTNLVRTVRLAFVPLCRMWSLEDWQMSVSSTWRRKPRPKKKKYAKYDLMHGVRACMYTRHAVMWLRNDASI